MKQALFFSMFLLLATTFTFGQSTPQLINYQAVARNASGQALANQTIKVKISLFTSEAAGTYTFYTETRSVTTNLLGLFNVQIGATGAINSSGSFSSTDWLDGTKTRNIKVELDVNNTGSFVDMGSQQLVSVPYALAAKDAETAKKISSPFVGFLAQKTLTTIISTTNALLPFDLETFDSTGVYNPATSEFTVPEDGMYFLFAKTTISISYTPTSTSERAAIDFWSTASSTSLSAVSGFGHDQTVTGGSTCISVEGIYFLHKNEKITVRVVRVNPAGNWGCSNNASRFGAYKIK